MSILDLTMKEIDQLDKDELIRLTDEFLLQSPIYDTPDGQMDMAGAEYEDYVASVYEDDE